MSIQVLSYHPSPHGSYQLGFAIVQIKEKSKMIVKVCQSKTNSIFCVAPSIKIGDKWMPSIEFLDKQGEKKFYHTVHEQLIPLMAQASESKPNVNEDPNPSMDDCPF